eukprot:scaffold1085_cov407-Prasinococcus_capsulatus_cf.AAC.38
MTRAAAWLAEEAMRVTRESRLPLCARSGRRALRRRNPSATRPDGTTHGSEASGLPVAYIPTVRNLPECNRPPPPHPSHGVAEPVQLDSLLRDRRQR